MGGDSKGGALQIPGSLHHGRPHLVCKHLLPNDEGPAEIILPEEAKTVPSPTAGPGKLLTCRN